MERVTPPAQRLVRWLLRRCSPDGAHVHGDLLEEYEKRRGRAGRLATDLWFVREVGLACWYGIGDSALDLGTAMRRGLAPGLSGRTIRALRRRPAFALTVLVLSGVSAGSVGALAGVTRVATRSSAPALDSVRLIVGTDAERGWPTAYLSLPELEDLEREVEVLGEVGAFVPSQTLRFGRGVEGRAIAAVFADASYFRALRARTRLGRIFTDAEAWARTGPVVVLSHRFWRESSGGDPGIVGRSIEIGGRAYEVVGVMDDGFRDPARSAATDVWLPMGDLDVFTGPGAASTRTFRWAFGIARVSPAATTELEAGLTRIARQLQRDHPIAHYGRGFALRDLGEWWYGGIRRRLLVMLLGGLTLLVVVLVNVGALFRVRAQEREGDTALRRALGATRGALLAVVLGEALVLAAAAAMIGVGVASVLLGRQDIDVLLRLPYFAMPEVDVLAVVVCAGLILPVAALAERRPGGGPPGARGRPLRGLLAAEAAVAAAFLTVGGAALMATSTLERTSTGFEPEGLLTARMHLTRVMEGSTAGPASSRARVTFARRLVDSAPMVDAVRSAALVGPSILGAAESHLGFTPEGTDPRERTGRWLAQRIVVTPGGLATLGVDIVAGRHLEWRDRDPGNPVAVVDERIARTFWPEGDAVGRRFCATTTCSRAFTIVGVSEVAKNRGRMALDQDVVGDVYVSYATWPTTDATLSVRMRGPSPDAARELRALVAELAPWVLVSDVRWMDERLRAAEALPRTTSALLATYAIVAVMLALVGTWGLVAFHVGRVRRDIALRVALGARRSTVAGALVREGVMPVGVGVMIGTIAGLGLVGPLAGLVFGNPGLGGWGWQESTAVGGLLCLSAIGAAAVPLLRLQTLRPMEVLRAD